MSKSQDRMRYLNTRVLFSLKIKRLKAYLLKFMFSVFLLQFANELVAQDLAAESEGLRKDPIWLNTSYSKGFLSTSLVLDDEGSIYTGGTFQTFFSSNDLAIDMPRLSHLENSPNYPFLQKHYSNGTLAWTKYAIGQGRLHALAVDKENNIYISGEVWSSDLIFTSKMGERDSLDKPNGISNGIYLAKFNPQGVLIASTYFSFERQDNVAAMAIDSEGNIILAGNYSYTLDSESISSYLLVKFDSNLKLLWHKDGGELGRSRFTAIHINAKGHMYLGGTFSNRLEIGERVLLNNHHAQKPFVAKLNKNGDLKWLQAEIIESSNAQSFGTISGISADKWGKVYFSGSIFSRLYFAKLKRRGAIKWKVISGGRSSYPFGLENIEGRNFILYGHGYGSSFWSHPKGDTLSYQSKGSTDFFILDYSSKSQLKGLLVGGGEGTDYISSMAFRDGKIYVLGHDLGGPPIEFGVHKTENSQAYKYRRPKLWLACFEWED